LRCPSRDCDNEWVRLLLVVVFLLLPVSNPPAQESDTGALLRRCAQNEVAALERLRPFTFKERLEWSWGSETRNVVETSQGRADRIIAFRDEPLNPEQQSKQTRRLKKLLVSSDDRREVLKEQKEEQQRRLKMARALPDAVLLQFAGSESDGQLRFAFSPNPKFSPQDRETQIYKAMQGTVWIDPVHERITRVRGELYKDVSFGWGIVGRLNKGGRYEASQAEVSPGVFRITQLNLDFRGSAFIFGHVRILRKESSTDFTPTPATTTFEEAVEKLMVAPAARAR